MFAIWQPLFWFKEVWHVNTQAFNIKRSNSICLICCVFVVQQAIGFSGKLLICCTAVRFVVDLYVNTLSHTFYL